MLQVGPPPVQDCSGKATLETCTVTALPGFTMTDSVLPVLRVVESRASMRGTCWFVVPKRALRTWAWGLRVFRAFRFEGNDRMLLAKVPSGRRSESCALQQLYRCTPQLA